LPFSFRTAPPRPAIPTPPSHSVVLGREYSNYFVLPLSTLSRFGVMGRAICVGLTPSRPRPLPDLHVDSFVCCHCPRPFAWSIEPYDSVPFGIFIFSLSSGRFTSLSRPDLPGSQAPQTFCPLRLAFPSPRLISTCRSRTFQRSLHRSSSRSSTI